MTKLERAVIRAAMRCLNEKGWAVHGILVDGKYVPVVNKPRAIESLERACAALKRKKSLMKG
jgi:hypothetical protein